MIEPIQTEAEVLARLRGPGVYPVEYARWLLNPLRHLICPTWLIVRRLRLKPTDRVLEIGSGPGYFSPSIACRLPAGRLTLFDVQRGMLELAARRLEKHGQRVVGAGEQNWRHCEAERSGSRKSKMI